jgi:peptidase M1-like protein
VPVTADVHQSGIEYPNLVFEGGAAVTRTLSHELAHQWFYSLVGNDQARDPWLDEGLATYAQFTHDHVTAYAGVRLPPAAAGHLGAPMTYWQRLPYRDYAAGVYLQGERAIATLGPRRLVDCALRGYVAANAYRIATQPDLARALARVIPSAPGHLRRLGARVARWRHR